MIFFGENRQILTKICACAPITFDSVFWPAQNFNTWQRMTFQKKLSVKFFDLTTRLPTNCDLNVTICGKKHVICWYVQCGKSCCTSATFSCIPVVPQHKVLVPHHKAPMFATLETSNFDIYDFFWGKSPNFNENLCLCAHNFWQCFLTGPKF